MDRKKVYKIMLFIFLIIQPVLDCYYLYSKKVIEFLGFSPTTIIRTIFIFVLFIILFFEKNTKKDKKHVILFLVLFSIYFIIHHLYSGNLTINNYKTFFYSSSTELLYMVRMLLPLIMIYIVKHINFSKSDFLKIIKIVSFITSSIIVFSNLFKISLTSYGNGMIQGNILDWFINYNKYDVLSLASKGWFNSANQISGLLMILFPFIVYSFLKDHNIKNFLLVVLQILAMMMLGTRSASYGWFLVVFLVLGEDIIFSIIKKTKINIKCYLLLGSLTALGIFFTFTYAPVVSSRMSETYAESDQKAQEEVEEAILKAKSVTKKKDKVKDNDDISIKDLVKLLAINPQYYTKIYPVNEHEDFWYEFIYNTPEKLKFGQRNIQLLITKDIDKNQKQTFTSIFGYGYSRFINAYIYMEHDFYVHYYTIGIVGIIFLLLPYIGIAIGGMIKLFEKGKYDVLDIVIVSTILMILCLSYVTGHIMDELIVSLFLGFICGFFCKRLERN